MNAKAFYDQFATKLLHDFHSGNPRIEEAILFACRQLTTEAPSHILDLGFGIGWSSHELSRALPESQVLGIDLSPELTKLACAMFGERERVAYLCQDLSDPEWAAASKPIYDACVMLDVYEHIPKTARETFHRSLSALLTENATLVLTCPTPAHQEYLRKNSPEGLQPVDEDVTLPDLLDLAAQLGGMLTHLEHKSIWATNDYFHATIRRRVARREKPTIALEHSLISRNERRERLSKGTPLVGLETVNSIIEEDPSAFQRAIRRLLRG